MRYIICQRIVITEDTLVLTEDGWKSHFDWNGERIAIYDPKSDELRLEKPLKFVQMPYDGKMVQIESRLFRHSCYAEWITGCLLVGESCWMEG